MGMALNDPLSRSQALIKEADQFMAQQKWQQAEERFRLAVRYLSRKNLPSEAVKPLLVQALTGWAECLLERGRFSDAAQIARKTLSLAPTSEKAQELLFHALLGAGRLDEARRQIRTLLRQQRENWRLHLWAAQVEAKLDNWREVTRHIVAALRLADKEVAPYELAAQLLEQRGEIQRAILLLRKGVEKVPHSPSLWFTLGRLLRNMGRHREALECFEQVLKLGDDSAALREIMGNICSELGWLDKALEHALQGLALEPENPNLLDLLAFVYLQKGQPRDALQALQRLVRLVPKDPLVHFKLATVHHQLGNYANAVMAYHRTIALAPGTELAREAQRILEMIDRQQLEQVFTLSMEDPIFRAKLMRNPQQALQEKGFLLSEASMEVILNTDFSQLPRRHGAVQRLVS